MPLIHGVDGFGQFSATILVDAAGVDPDVFQIVSLSLLTAVEELLIAILVTWGYAKHVLEADFFGTPYL